MAEAIIEFQKIFQKAVQETENLKNSLWLRVQANTRLFEK